jgi:hypothetical protein
MSAPDTTLEKQKRRHRVPLVGMAVVLTFVGVLLAGYLLVIADDGGTPEQTESEIDGGTGESTPVQQDVGDPAGPTTPVPAEPDLPDTPQPPDLPDTPQPPDLPDPVVTPDPGPDVVPADPPMIEPADPPIPPARAG